MEEILNGRIVKIALKLNPFDFKVPFINAIFLSQNDVNNFSQFFSHGLVI